MSKQIFFICVVVMFTFLNCSTKKTTAEGDPLSLPSEIITDNIMSHLSVVADTIYEPGIENPILINIKLYYKDSLIHHNSESLYECGSVQNIPYNDSVAYVLINEFDPISSKTLNVWRCSTKEKVLSQVVDGQVIKDIDDDGVLEIIGQEIVEAACIQCDSSFYSPIHVYKLGIYCTEDNGLSEELTILKYGCYLGDKYKDTILPIKPIYYNSDTLW